jgi:hypothetical protein
MRMRTRFEERKVRLEARDGPASIAIDLSSPGAGQPATPALCRSTAHAESVGPGRSSSSSRISADTGVHGAAQATTAGRVLKAKLTL